MIDPAFRVIQLAAENEALRTGLADLQARFNRLTPKGQRAAVNYEALLMILMHFRGIPEWEVPASDVVGMPRNLCLVFDGGSDGQSVHVRLMTHGKVDASVNPHLVN